MKCPLCKTAALAPSHLENHLIARTCGECDGLWISGRDYYEWLEKHEPDKDERPFSDVSLDAVSSSTAKLCPDCGRIMMKYKVGHGINFMLDRCTGCGGVWFDKNEWKILKSRHLHDELRRIFSTGWGHEVLKSESAIHLEKIYASKLGEKDYAEILRIRDWLRKHPQRSLLLSFLKEPEHSGQ